MDEERELPLAVLAYFEIPCNEFLIWSFEHNGWWKRNSLGYTRDIEQAGVYSLKTVKQIVRDANRYSISEAALPAPIARELYNSWTSGQPDLIH